MLYTPSHAELAQHPKTRKLARLLGVSIPTALGHLHLLWHFALKYAPDGALGRFDCDEIADGCLWEGEGMAFTSALIVSGWLDKASDGSTAIHDWNDHGGKAIRQTKRNAERQQEWRDRHKTGTPASPNSPVTVTSPSHNALDKKRRDKKREEEIVEVGALSEGVQGEPSPVPRPKPQRAVRATPAPDTFPVTPAMLAWAAEHAPGVDVATETARFLDRNRSKGGEYVDWLAAWRNWLTSPYAKAPSVPARASPNGPHPSTESAKFGRSLSALQQVGGKRG